MYKIRIYNPHPFTSPKEYTKKECNKFIRKVIESGKGSIEIYKIESNGWRTKVFSHYTKNEFWLKKN